MEQIKKYVYINKFYIYYLNQCSEQALTIKVSLAKVIINFSNYSFVFCYPNSALLSLFS